MEQLFRIAFTVYNFTNFARVHISPYHMSSGVKSNSILCTMVASRRFVAAKVIFSPVAKADCLSNPGSCADGKPCHLFLSAKNDLLWCKPETQ